MCDNGNASVKLAYAYANLVLLRSAILMNDNVDTLRRAAMDKEIKTVRTFAAPGRIEIGGNHTDHQRGVVLAAAVDLESRCIVSPNGTNTVRIESQGFGITEVDISDVSVRENERGSTAALIRGVAAWFKTHGFAVVGFDGRVSSDIPAGSGLSSSAAFEVLTGNVFCGLSGADVSPLDIALAGQYAENVYFGKPSGLMDQVSSAFGGLVMIDFQDPDKPLITPIRADFEGFAVCVVDTGGSHADLTPNYAEISEEMRSVSNAFGKDYLREVREDEFYSSVGELRRLGDRAVLRAVHFFGENLRVPKQAVALEKGNLSGFLEMVRDSGRSSLQYLQNAYDPAVPGEQGLTLALALSERVLGDSGASRINGGGFAGTILSFVPDSMRDEYSSSMSAAFGAGACRFLNIRSSGGGEIV